MEGEWHTLYRIEEKSDLISLLREYEVKTITRNAMRCNNRYDLLNLSRGILRGEAGDVRTLSFWNHLFFCFFFAIT